MEGTEVGFKGIQNINWYDFVSNPFVEEKLIKSVRNIYRQCLSEDFNVQAIKKLLQTLIQDTWKEKSNFKTVVMQNSYLFLRFIYNLDLP